ncbi:FAD-dependent oxidoreductase, partial [Nonomuraea angiospora]
GPKAPAFFVFASERLDYDRYDMRQQKDLLTRAYAGLGWQGPALMEAVRRSPDVYLDSISQISIDRYSQGRVVLLGDAAYGNTLAGFGTGLAVVGAYVLAGELKRAGGDHRVAFAQYEEQMRGYAKIAKNGNAGPFLAPRTRRGIRMRNWIFKYNFLFGWMMKMTDKFANDIALKEY